MLFSTNEKLRLKKMSLYEKELYARGYTAIAGVDEAGRGPLAGPVVAAACVLPKGFLLEHLNDSKQLSSQVREILFQKLTHHPDVVFGVGIVNEKTIDRINILQATFLAMKEAISNLQVQPDFILFDGNRAPLSSFPHQCIVAGDAISISIAAASIIAKQTRDHIMEEMAKQFPVYGFAKHKGYGTKQHREAIEKFGPCPIHRRSFEPVASYGTYQETFL
ncbi:MAG: ribonuclease HII [Chlamydiota bacterium]